MRSKVLWRCTITHCSHVPCGSMAACTGASLASAALPRVKAGSTSCYSHAALTSSAAQVSENNESVFNFSRAAIIDELEASLPAWFRNIWAGTWYPAYVHYLQVRSRAAVSAHW